ncbi:hypothetical protein RRG08_033211 [Elysia crispata]|uniref:Uncharacterized protein n=1 Tax=Elysia crispata TaxID=231223 RepID=A0AAE1BAH1_9GAST|nr:hypothetical protein RRG08_033211 [Elysia crispata]
MQLSKSLSVLYQEKSLKYGCKYSKVRNASPHSTTYEQSQAAPGHLTLALNSSQETRISRSSEGKNVETAPTCSRSPPCDADCAGVFTHKAQTVRDRCMAACSNKPSMWRSNIAQTVDRCLANKEFLYLNPDVDILRFKWPLDLDSFAVLGSVRNILAGACGILVTGDGASLVHPYCA